MEQQKQSFTISARLEQLSSAIFAEVQIWKQTARERGHSIIDLGIGSPDQPPSARVQQALLTALQQPDAFGYPTSEGTQQFRSAVARWYAYRFGVELDSEQEIVTLMGSQDGLSHLALALTDPGDLAIVPDPGYPIYSGSLILAGVEAYHVPLTSGLDFLPDLDAIPLEVAKRAKFMLLNYPSNPVSATANLAFFERWVAWARRHEVWLVHDLAYSEMAFDGFRPPSILEVPGAKELAVEFHSLSKSFNMAGCRIAYMAGSAKVVAALRSLKSNIDYGVFLPVQLAGIAALEEDMEGAPSVGHLYQSRRDAFIEVLARYGWIIPKPRATMFVWAPIPKNTTSRQISREILIDTGVVVIPGDAFGRMGEGYVRIALVQDMPFLLEAAHRLGRYMKRRWEHENQHEEE